MRMLSDSGSVSSADAWQILAAIKGKDRRSVDAERDNYFTASATMSRDTQLATWAFGFVERFARYSFCKAHAIAEAVLTIQTAYLKLHFPVEFEAAADRCLRDHRDASSLRSPADS